MAKSTPDQSQQSESFLCFALHSLPNEALLAEHTEANKIGNYTFKRMGQRGQRKRNVINQGECCIIRLERKAIEILPLPPAIQADNAPYALAYNFYFATQQAATQDTDDTTNVSLQYYNIVANCYGFSIATLPSHDMRRAMSAKTLNQRENALIYADRAFISVAEHSTFGREVERAYDKYQKLLNLYIDQSQQPEGLLAYERCWQQLIKAYTLCLSSAKKGE